MFKNKNKINNFVRELDKMTVIKLKNIINESQSLLDGSHTVEKIISKLVIYLKKISRRKHRDESYF